MGIALWALRPRHSRCFSRNVSVGKVIDLSELASLTYRCLSFSLQEQERKRWEAEKARQVSFLPYLLRML